MEGFSSPNPMKNKIISFASSSESDQDSYEEDSCSICFEFFTSEDPATVTKCKHEYHLQCILEWSQRSKECPICWQLLVLKDPSSQELLAAVEIERKSRSRTVLSNIPASRRFSFEETEPDIVQQYTDDSDTEENIMQQLSASGMGRIHQFSSRERHRSYPHHDTFLGFDAPSNDPGLGQANAHAPVEGRNLGPPGVHVATSSQLSDRPPSTVHTSRIDEHSNIMYNLQSPTPRVCTTTPRKSQASDLLSFSESLKSRFSAASARYKESISKGTRGFKEKLLARKNSVKELSKEVQREVTAGISGAARMVERLDPTSKRTVPSSGPVTSGSVKFLDLFLNKKVVQKNLNTPSRIGNDRETGSGTNSNTSVYDSGNLSSIPSRMRITRVQDVLRCKGDKDLGLLQ